ncbi:uncharacterized protein BO66DRAFT_464598 [Aspergillus aculeatinus CBS 121060]|uniref:Uncharacterized protein n=1 Tax=Aspergillus aculeatinus CBS 121060 TaxID=1448322 RepID=A0ACD1GSR4_9EURO|nr:hypothetical protein BO66DRAFT_464598 [Aspergillus aculeatinus CBS 121060]RAH64367.1 hypothetical protein BO66DRAFT_464598 [Aspergillus aculeatinus CBS 121060]
MLACVMRRERIPKCRSHPAWPAIGHADSTHIVVFRVALVLVHGLMVHFLLLFPGARRLPALLGRMLRSQPRRATARAAVDQPDISLRQLVDPQLRHTAQMEAAVAVRALVQRPLRILLEAVAQPTLEMRHPRALHRDLEGAELLRQIVHVVCEVEVVTWRRHVGCRSVS